MDTVLITKFSDDGKQFDWVHDCGETSHGENVNINSLIYASDIGGGINKTVLIVQCSVCHAESYYPMSGGDIAQLLHKHYLEQKLLSDVQNDATARNIEISRKTQAQLIIEIIKDECNKRGCPYLL